MTIKNTFKDKKWIFVAIVVLAAACMIAIGAFWAIRRRPVAGIEIAPGAEWVCGNPVYYRQNDEEWKSERMGTAADTLGGSGCLVTCLAASMEMQKGAVEAGYRMTPGELNRELSENQVYDDRANVLWNPLREYLTEWTVLTPSKADGTEIERMLNDGHFPIVKVRMPRSGANHWVMLVEARDGEYYCMDPLHGADEMVPLSEFGNVVYSVRCICYNE